MYRCHRWLIATALIALAGCASDSSCGGCRHGLFSRLTSRSRDADCCPCPCPGIEEPCCDSGFGGAPFVGSAQGVEAFSPPPFNAIPAQPLPPTSQPMAKPVPYAPNGK